MKPVLVEWLAGIKTVLAGLIIGTMAVVFVVSKAALVFSGELSPFLSQGIGFILLGSVLMTGVTLLSVNSRGSIVGPQDVTSVMVASAAGALVGSAGLEGDAAFSTVVVMVGLSSLMAGATAYGVGYFKLAHLVRYVPSQVIAGFLAASGLLLLREAFTIVLPEASMRSMGALLQHLPQWLPWLIVAATLSLVVRRLGGGLVVPLAFTAAGSAFYGALPMLGLDLAAARDAGWLLGPFQQDMLLQAPSIAMVQSVQWHALPAMLPMLGVVVGLCLLGALMNLISLEMLEKRDSDLNGILKTLGWANATSGLVGGLSGYHFVSMTGLARRSGMSGASMGLSVLFASVLCLVFGASALENLPRGLAACVIWYLGFDLLLSSLWDNRSRFSRHDLALVVAIPMVALTLGVLPALGLGLLAACLLFVVVDARVDVVRLFTTGEHLRARVERGPRERDILRRAGHRVHIYKLSGFLFFGTVQRLLPRLQGSLDSDSPPQTIVLDLSRLVGMDLSASDALGRLAQRCSERSVRLILTRPSAAQDAGHFQALQSGAATPMLVADNLDAALTELEAQCLKEARLEHPVSEHDDHRLAPEVFLQHGEKRTHKTGETIIEEGAPSDSVMLLLSGQLEVVVNLSSGRSTTLNRLLPGAIFGEAGFYSEARRSASVVAAQDSEILLITAAQVKQMEEHAAEDAAKLHRALARVVSERLITATHLLRDAEI